MDIMYEQIQKADELMRQGKSSEAISIINDVIKETPDDPYPHYLLGIARMKCGRFFLAKQALEKADQLMPHKSDNLRSLGWVKVMLGQVDEGRNDLREAISLDLTNPLSYIDLAMSYFHYFDFREGMEWLERAKALAPQDPYVLDNFKMAKEMEKESLRYSAKEIEKMRKQKLDPKSQLSFSMAILEMSYSGKPLTKDDAEEIREEGRLSGMPISIVSDKDEREIIASKKNNSSKIKEIKKRRREIEVETAKILEETKSDLKLDDIKDVIYNEENQEDFMKITSKVVSTMSLGQNIVKLQSALELLNNAWNYFPHKVLGGLCPIEKVLEYQRDKQ